jgi:asparagine synthase (glutamine-hydrolysing)
MLRRHDAEGNGLPVAARKERTNMCGLIALRCAGVAQQDVARRGLSAIAHRGPDGQGLLTFEGPPATVLGHRRLSILDLKATAAQPMVCPETGNAIVFNGEIYNFIELRRELEERGERFRTDGDTEVILKGWRVWGAEIFSRCNGMWALALLERSSGDLIACRDRLGVKPLYLHRERDTVMLASEIRAIATMRGGYAAPNPQAIFDFLTLGLSDHGTQTFFEGVEAVPAGTILRIAPDGGTVSRSYHRWPLPGEVTAPVAADIRDLVTDATLLRLRSDVPTVSFLSGGLDSSIITQLGLRAGALPRVDFSGAFTYGYRDEALVRFDETERARAFMGELGEAARHHVRRLRAVGDQAELLELVAAQDEPFSTPSILASFRMYRALRDDGCKVVLSGEGADELFGGYVRAYHALAARDALLDGNLTAAFALVACRSAQPGLVLNRLAWDLPLPVLAGLLRRRRPSVAIMSQALWDRGRGRLAELQDDRRCDLGERMRRDVLSTNLPTILRMTDRNSMHFGIEVRSPFLDYRLVERALSTPVERRIGGFQGKALLREAFAGELPERIVTERKTTGFGHAEQFLVGELPIGDLLEDLPASLGDYLDVGRLRKGFARGGLHPTFWLALSVALWYRRTYA